MSTLDAQFPSSSDTVELTQYDSSAALTADELDAPLGQFYVVIDEAITEVDDGGGAYTAYGFLVTWRGRQSGGYRRFHEFRAVAQQLATPDGLPGLRFPLWPWPPSSWRMSPGVIETRASGLQSYLSEALKACAARGTMPLVLSRFLRLPSEEGEPLPAGPPSPGGGGARDSAASEEDDGGGDAMCAVAPSLQRMRRHVAALSMLRVRLQRSVRPAGDVAPDGEAPYEELDSSARLVDALQAPIARIEELLDQLRLHHAVDLDPTWGGHASPLGAASPRQIGNAPSATDPHPPLPNPPNRAARAAERGGEAHNNNKSNEPSLIERLVPRGLLARFGVAKASEDEPPVVRSASGRVRVVVQPTSAAAL